MSRREPGRRLFDDKSAYIDRFGLLLIITCAAVVTLSLVDLRSGSDSPAANLGVLVVSIFVGATLLLSVRASGVSRTFQIAADIVVGIGVVATFVLVILDLVTDSGYAAIDNPPVVWLILALLAPLAVVRRLVKHRKASGATLLGAVSAYLLIALGFNFGFLAVDAYGSVPFFGSEQPSTSFMYFSLVTITTLGYGDLSAAEPFGRLLSTIEAVTGQVYLVTFVAMIVGLIVGQREQRVDWGAGGQEGKEQ